MKDYIIKVEECLDIVRENYPNTLNIPVKNDILVNAEFMNSGILAFTTHYPWAKHIRFVIALNRKLHEHHSDIYLREIIPHEMAHVICFNNNVSTNAHCDTWKELCKLMGGSGEKSIKYRCTQ